MAVFAVSGSMVLLAHQVHKRILSNFMKKFEFEIYPHGHKKLHGNIFILLFVHLNYEFLTWLINIIRHGFLICFCKAMINIKQRKRCGFQNK